MKIVARNKKAFFDYQILEKFEAGLVLLGAEIKAIRVGRINIDGSYIKKLSNSDDLWWIGGQLDLTGVDQNRSRRILLHRSELDRLIGRLSTKNLTVVPLELYLKRGLAKLSIGLASRRQKQDKRQVLKDRDLKRQVEKRLKTARD